MKIPKPFSDNALRKLFSELSSKESFVFLESSRVTPENHLSYLFEEPLERLVYRPGDDPAAFFYRAQKKLEKGFFLAGYLGYEFGYMLEPFLLKDFRVTRPREKSGGSLPLADLGVFEEPRIYDHRTETCSREYVWPTGGKTDPEPGYSIDNLRLNQEREEYLKAIHRIKSYIAAGDTYQVNYTLKILFDFAGSVPGFYCSLRRNQHVCYGGFIKNGDTAMLTFSPELFFRKRNNTIDVRPMKGTMRRGRTISEDRKFVDLLHRDIKNRSENVMIVDLLRNDLGRLSCMGGVSVQSLFDVETYETLHQMTSSIRGEVDRPVSLEETFKALFPCGSVTGAPKIRTMEIIRELEAEDRGVYTGAIGFVAPDGQAVFNVPIRTVVLRGSRGEMGIGSGIVWDSDPDGEWEECKLKGQFLTRPLPEFRLIETMLWNSEYGYWLLDMHLDRMAESARYFGYVFEREKIIEAIQALTTSFHCSTPQKNQRVRLVLSKTGELEINHSFLNEDCLPESDPALIMQQNGKGDFPKAVFSERNTDSHSMFLFHKTTLRKHYDDERTRFVAQGNFCEVFFVNENGEVTEGSYTNIFMQQDNRLITPPVSCGLLPGVFRRYLLQKYPYHVVERKFTRADLEQAEAVYAGNSVRGLVRVAL